MNKSVIYAQELNTETGTISEICADEILNILKEYEHYNSGYTILNEKLDDDIWKTMVCSGDGNWILEIYTKYEPYISENEFYYQNL